MKKHSNPYEVLGVPPTSTVEEVSAAYKKLVKTHHPDLHQDAAKKKESEETMKKINVAYDEITNPKQHSRGGSPFNDDNLNEMFGDLFGNRQGGRNPFHDFFGRCGNTFHFSSTQTICCELPLSITKAVLGGEVEYESPVGKLKFNLPPATQPGFVFNLQVNKDSNSTIILQIHVKVIIPSNLTDEQKKKLEELGI